jgi:hypothetical protein
VQRRGAVAVDQVNVRAVIEQRVDDVSARGGLLLVVLGAVDEALEGDGEGGGFRVILETRRDELKRTNASFQTRTRVKVPSVVT